MKRSIFIIAAMGMLLTSCGVPSGSSADGFSSSETEPSTDTTKADTEKHYAANGVELKVDMSRYSENAKLLTADDIYLVSSNCGYVSGEGSYFIAIADQEQLDCAREKYGLALPPEGISDDELWRYDTVISEPFNDMAEKYPLDEYTYVLEYDEVSSGGYDIRVGALLVDEDNLFFVRTADSKTPDPDEPQTDEMGGYCFMAAVPKDMLMNEHYKKVVYPEGTIERESSVKEKPVAEQSNKDNGDKIDDGYIAVFQGGSGEQVRRTYVYKTDNGYSYINVTSTTVSWGSHQWKNRIDSRGEAADREGIVKAAKAHNAAQFVIIGEDRDTHPIEEFIDAELYCSPN